MNKQETYNAIANAMEYIGEAEAKKRNIRADIHIIKEDLPEDLRDQILDLVIRQEAKRDTRYRMVFQACNIIAYANIDELDNIENNGDIASVYTSARLSYLTIYNQEEISEIVRGHGGEIQEACASWYDAAVMSIVRELVDIIDNADDADCLTCDSTGQISENEKCLNCNA